MSSSQDGSGSPSGSKSGSDSESLSSGTKRKFAKLLKKQDRRKPVRSMLHGESDDDDDVDGHPESDQLRFAGMNIEPSSRRLVAKKESSKAPSARGSGKKNSGPGSASSRRSKAEDYSSQTTLADFVDSHLVDWIDGAEGSHCNRTRISDLARSILFSLLLFMTGWLPNRR